MCGITMYVIIPSVASRLRGLDLGYAGNTAHVKYSRDNKASIYGIEHEGVDKRISSDGSKSS